MRQTDLLACGANVQVSGRTASDKIYFYIMLLFYRYSADGVNGTDDGRDLHGERFPHLHELTNDSRKEVPLKLVGDNVSNNRWAGDYLKRELHTYTPTHTHTCTHTWHLFSLSLALLRNAIETMYELLRMYCKLKPGFKRIFEIELFAYLFVTN